MIHRYGRSTASHRLNRARRHYADARRLLSLANVTGAAKGPAFSYLNRARRDLEAACAFAEGWLAAAAARRNDAQYHN